MFPWDSFILEVTFLTLWLPATRTLLPSSITTAWAGVAEAVACSIASTTCSTTAAAALTSLASAVATSAVGLLASIPLVGGAASAAASALTGIMSSPATPAPSFSESISMVSPPGALLAFMFRYALVRLLVGFGKMKFQGSTWRDRR